VVGWIVAGAAMSISRRRLESQRGTRSRGAESPDRRRGAVRCRRPCERDLSPWCCHAAPPFL